MGNETVESYLSATSRVAQVLRLVLDRGSMEQKRSACASLCQMYPSSAISVRKALRTVCLTSQVVDDAEELFHCVRGILHSHTFRHQTDRWKRKVERTAMYLIVIEAARQGMHGCTVQWEHDEFRKHTFLDEIWRCKNDDEALKVCVEKLYEGRIPFQDIEQEIQRDRNKWEARFIIARERLHEQ